MLHPGRQKIQCPENSEDRERGLVQKKAKDTGRKEGKTVRYNPEAGARCRGEVAQRMEYGGRHDAGITGGPDQRLEEGKEARSSWT